MKRLLAILVTAMMVVMLFAGCSPSSPVGAKGKLTKDYVEQNKLEVLMNSVDFRELFPEWENPFALLMTDPESLRCEIGLEQKGLEIGGAMAVDSQKGVGSLDFLMHMAGLDAPLDVALYVDQKQLVLSSDAFLGEGSAYSLTFDTPENLAKAFDASAFAKVFGLPEGTAAAFLEEYGLNDAYFASASAAIEAYQKKLTELENAVETDIYALLAPYFGEVTEDTITFGETPTKVIGVAITSNDALIGDLLDWYVAYYQESMAAQTELISALCPEALREDFLTSYMESQPNIEELRKTLEESLAGFSMNLVEVVYLDKATGRALSSHTTGTVTVDGAAMAVEYTATLADGIGFTGTVSVEESVLYFDGSLRCDATGAFLDITANDGGEAQIAFEINKAEESYKLYMTTSENNREPLEVFSVDGILNYSDKFFEMSIDSVLTDGNVTPFGFTLAFTTEPDIKAPKQAKDILSLTEDEVYAIVGRFGTALGNAAGAFAPQEDEPYDDTEGVIVPDFEYVPITYDDYDEFAEYYTYEEFCAFVDAYNELYAPK